MSAYKELKIKIEPYSEDAADLLAAFLADIDYESFVAMEDGLAAYVPADKFDEAALLGIKENFPIEAELEFQHADIQSRDWNEEWEKNYFQPIVIGDRCVIHSSFHNDVPSAEYDITIDPKMAFGTGHHATTSMMVRFLLEEELNGKSVIDMGSGTGILAILAHNRSASAVSAVEIDGMACENAIENFQLNDAVVTLYHGDSKELEKCEPADIFMANINRNVILADLDRYVSRIKPDGLLLLSGFLQNDIPLVERAASMKGFKIIETKQEDGDWVALKLKRDN